MCCNTGSVTLGSYLTLLISVLSPVRQGSNTLFIRLGRTPIYNADYHNLDNLFPTSFIQCCGKIFGIKMKAFFPLYNFTQILESTLNLEEKKNSMH